MAAVPPQVVAAALAETAALGGFFAVTTGPRTGEWLPFDALLQPRERIAATRTALATSARVEASGIAWRVAASTVSLGLFARLIAPFVGSLVTTGVLPDVTRETLWWQQVSGLVPMSLDPVAGRAGDATVFARSVLDGLISPLVDTFTSEGVSPVIVIGNVASAIGGAAVMISTARPELAGAAWSLTAELLQLPMLAGAAGITPTGLRPGVVLPVLPGARRRFLRRLHPGRPGRLQPVKWPPAGIGAQASRRRSSAPRIVSRSPSR